MMKPIITQSLLVLLIIGTVTIAGCQKKVVRETYSPYTGLSDESYRPRTGLSTPQRNKSANAAVKQEKKGFLEGIGDFMFGWMDDPDAKEDSKSGVPSKPVWEKRAGQNQQQ